MKQTSRFAFQQKIQFWTISPSVTSQRSTIPHWNLQPTISFSRRWNWKLIFQAKFAVCLGGKSQFFFFMWFTMKWRDDDVISDWGTNSFQRWRSHIFQFFPKRQTRRWREKRHMCVRARRLSLVFNGRLFPGVRELLTAVSSNHVARFTRQTGGKKIKETATRETPSCGLQT